jgi:hypothetical protein
VIYAWVRRTVEWSDTEAFRAQLSARFEPQVSLWDRTFDMPYNVFRDRVREIARRNLADADGVRVADWDEIPDGAPVIPLDDDDWIAPFAGPALEDEAAAGGFAWRWPARFVEVPMGPGHRLYLARRRLMPWSAEAWYCSTNNYAMRKGAAEQDVLGKHYVASPRFLEWRRRGWLGIVERPLTAMNRTLASQTSLRFDKPLISQRNLRAKYRRHLRLYRRPVRGDLGWAQPYVEMMGELMSELGPRRGSA